MLATMATSLLLILSMGQTALSAKLRLNTESSQLYALEDQWVQFQCHYDASKDSFGAHELGATLQACDRELKLHLKYADFQASMVAAVLGKMSQISRDMRERVIRDRDIPVFRANPGHSLVAAGLAEATGDAGRILLRIRARTNVTEGLCAVCGQVQDSTSYTVTKSKAVRVVRPPKALLTFDGASGKQTAEDGLSRWTTEEGLNSSVSCTGSGLEVTAMRLLRNGELLKETAGANLRLTLSPVDSSMAGRYRCEAVSSLEFLVTHGANLGIAQAYMAVNFSPRFELEEIVRYTPVGQQEDVQVKVFAHPEAQLACTPAPSQMSQQGAFDPVGGFSIYLLRLSNAVNNAANRTNATKFVCVASNTLGSRRLVIQLTARAPRPRILSPASDTVLGNSAGGYLLRWRHDAGANIDFYRLEIRFNNGNSSTWREEFTPTAPTMPSGGGGGGDAMPLVDQTKKQKLGASSLGTVSQEPEQTRRLVKLQPDTEHEIRLSACNRHGCSEPSDPVRVTTQKQNAQAYYDPANPMRGINNPNAASSSHLMHGSSMLLVSIALSFGAALPISE